MGAKDIEKYRFKPGQSGNPGGKTGVKSAFRRVSREWANELAHYFFERPHTEFIDWLNEHCRSASEKLVGTVVRRAAERGDANAMALLFDTLIMPEKESKATAPTVLDAEATALDGMSDEQIEAELARLDATDGAST